MPRDQLKSKGQGKLSIHCAADLETVETVFRMIDFAYQLSLYRAVAEICEEYESIHERTTETRYDGAIEFLTRDQRDLDRSAFGL